MNPAFFQQMETILAPERLDAYRPDEAAPAHTLARYPLNMPPCATTFPPPHVAAPQPGSFASFTE